MSNANKLHYILFLWTLYDRSYRSMKIKLHDGVDDKAPSFIQYDRAFACMPSNLKCCCYQEMSAKILTDEKKEEGKAIGSFIESFYWCHTQFNVVDEEGKIAYHVRLILLSVITLLFL